MLLNTGRRAQSEKLLRDSIEIARQTGISFIGPRLYGLAALATADAANRARALSLGEEAIGGGCNAHNVLWFYRDAIDASLDGGDWNGATGYADSLARFTEPEPLAWAEFFIARGRALASFGEGDRSEATLGELHRLRDEAERVGIRAAVPALAAALDAAA